jgi:hypothetical protein
MGIGLCSRTRRGPFRVNDGYPNYRLLDILAYEVACRSTKDLLHVLLLHALFFCRDPCLLPREVRL